MNLKTGKSQRLKLYTKRDRAVKCLQSDSSHLIVASEKSLRILSVEFESLKEPMIDLS